MSDHLAHSFPGVGQWSLDQAQGRDSLKARLRLEERLDRLEAHAVGLAVYAARQRKAERERKAEELAQAIAAMQAVTAHLRPSKPQPKAEPLRVSGSGSGSGSVADSKLQQLAAKFNTARR